jgi:acetolactate synthase I/III small subunit
VGGGGAVKSYTLSVLVENHPGVLTRVAGLIARRGYNIESLAVGPTENEDTSRITLAVVVEDELVLDQITKQLNKLVEVLTIVELGESAVERELMLIKLKSDPATRSQIIEIVQLFRGKTVDVHNDSMTIEATGSPEKLAALMQMLQPYGVREVVQSGLVALARGSRTLTDSARFDQTRPRNN